jgi:peptide/nickel transport system substrate-binding protein
MVSIQSGGPGSPDLAHHLSAQASRRSFLRGTLLGSVVLALPGALSACAPPTSGSSASGAQATGTPASASATVAVDTTKAFRVGWKSDIDTLNPLTSETTEAVEVYSLVYDTLLTYGLDLTPEPALATTSTQSGPAITYTLREGVTWHDGTPFTADDVVFTFDVIAKNSLGVNAQYLTELVSAKASDAKTVVLTFQTAQSFDPGLVVPILPKHIWSSMTPDQMRKFPDAAPVGTGPFVFGARKQGQSVSLTRNEKWWGSRPAAAAVSWAVYTNDDVLAQALKTGDVDMVPQVPPTVFGGLKGDQSLHTVTLDSFSFHHIGINVSKNAKSKGNRLLLDKNVRQALGYALDRTQIAQIAYAGQATPGDSILMPTFGDYYWKPTGDQVIDHNPDKANQVLDAAGYTQKDGSGIRKSKDGRSLTFRIIAIDSTSVDVRTAQLFQASALKVGIKLDFATVDSDTMASTVYNVDGPDWDLFVWGWDSGVYDPSYMLGVPLTSQIGGNNDVFYSNPTYDALYLQQGSELDHTKRVALVHQMQQMFYEECAYLVAVYTKKLQAYRGWTNLTEVPGGIVFNFTRDNYLKTTPA